MKDYSDLTGTDFQEGQILCIDKPLQWTSFDAVKKVRFAIRKAFDLKKIKVGHAGTLDPLATGLLIICTGKFTKQIDRITGQDKTYTGTFMLGATTASYDLETAVDNEQSTAHITQEMVREAAIKMSGVQAQLPPQFSAKQVDGKRAYQLARKGIEVVLQPREIEIKKFEVDTGSLPEVGFEITCSKGTYIRSIARDLGEILGCGAHLTKLVRTSIGDYTLSGALSAEDFSAQLGGGSGSDPEHGLP